MIEAKFVVVGHPNKGKSSIVSALVMDDSIAISDTPGTTKQNRSFFLKVDGKTLYELIDTPGFQRPKRVLKYLKSFGEVSALERPNLLKKFYDEFRDDESFADEIELLEPIINGAGIIYVVDASKPYSSEYETQMEILRYSGNPSMAILNFIGDEDFTKEWDIVLGQYFRLVKRFNPLSATKEEHIDLLEAMSHLNPNWQSSMKNAIKYLKSFYYNNKKKIAYEIAKSISAVLSYSVESSKSDKIRVQNELKEKFRKKIVSTEKRMQESIKGILNFKNIEFNVEDKNLEFDLLSQRSREVFGLSREKLLLMSAVSGGLAGGGIDLAFGGHTFLLGSVIGALGAVATTLYGYDEISKIKFISKDVMRIGPIKDMNFGFIFLNRALLYAKTLLNKSHSNRKKEKISYDIESMIDDESLKELSKLHSKFRKDVKDEDIARYADIVLKNL